MPPSAISTCPVLFQALLPLPPAATANSKGRFKVSMNQPLRPGVVLSK